MKFVDLHCDTITKAFDKNENLYENSLQLDLKRMLKYEKSIQFFAIWLNKNLYENSFYNTKKYIEYFNTQMYLNKKYIKQAKSFKDIINNQKQNKISAILSLEGCESIESNLNNIEKLHKWGVRLVNLCWNYENNLGYGVLANSKNGLKDFGKEVVKILNEKNIIIDVSHLNEKGFWDVYKMSKKPFIASHSNCYSICEHIRNLKNDQIFAIKEKQGIIGINFYSPFLTKLENATFSHITKHIDYIGNLIGFENICIGGDLDGIDLFPKDLEEVSKYILLYEHIINCYGLKIANKIFYENAFNFLKNNLV